MAHMELGWASSKLTIGTEQLGEHHCRRLSCSSNVAQKQAMKSHSVRFPSTNIKFAKGYIVWKTTFKIRGTTSDFNPIWFLRRFRHVPRKSWKLTSWFTRMLQSLLQVVLKWVLGTQTPSKRLFRALGLNHSCLISNPVAAKPLDLLRWSFANRPRRSQSHCPSPHDIEWAKTGDVCCSGKEIKFR